MKKKASPRTARPAAPFAAERVPEALGELLASDPQAAVTFRASERLREAAAKVSAAYASPNGKGWMRLCELLALAADDLAVKASPGASEFLAVVRVLAEDGVLDQSADPRFREVHRLMSASGAHRPRTPNHEAISKRHAALVAQGWPKMKADEKTAELFGCKTRLVRDIRSKK